jgi:hypothetical protein
MNLTEGIVVAVFTLLALLLLLSGLRQPVGSPARKARLRAGFIFAVVGILNCFWYLRGP